jgi:hypothetical protein
VRVARVQVRTNTRVHLDIKRCASYELNVTVENTMQIKNFSSSYTEFVYLGKISVIRYCYVTCYLNIIRRFCYLFGNFHRFRRKAP